MRIEWFFILSTHCFFKYRTGADFIKLKFIIMLCSCIGTLNGLRAKQSKSSNCKYWQLDAVVLSYYKNVYWFFMVILMYAFYQLFPGTINKYVCLCNWKKSRVILLCFLLIYIVYIFSVLAHSILSSLGFHSLQASSFMKKHKYIERAQWENN